MHEQVFNKIISNIFHNFILNKLIICDDKVTPWINDEIKTLSITTDISNPVNFSKLKYQDHLAKMLNNPKTAAKTYWSTLKAFGNVFKTLLIQRT